MQKVLSNFLRQPGNALASIVQRPGTVSSVWKQSLTNVLTEAVRGYVARYDPRQYLHAVHRETDRIVCESMIQEAAHRHIFVDVRTAAERADNSAPETDAADESIQRPATGCCGGSNKADEPGVGKVCVDRLV